MIRRILLTLFMVGICMSAWGQMTLEEAQKKANAGDVKAQFALAEAYYFGEAGLTKSYEEALKWYRKAANQGHAESMYAIYICYINGYGVEQNRKEAFKWLIKAADKGIDVAQFNLAVEYNNGGEVPQSYTEAAKWYKKAADQGHAESILNLGVLYVEGNGVPQSCKEAERLFLKAAELGDATAMYDLAVLYDEDYIENKGAEDALPWYRKAAENGHAGAQCELGRIIWADAKTIAEHEEALSWLRKAKAQGEEDAEELIEWVEEDLEDLREEEKAKSQTVASSTPSYTQTYTPSYRSRYRSHSFNTPYWDERPWGLSIGYVQKTWSYKPRPEYASEYDDIEEFYGVFSDDGEATRVSGIQMGLRYEPQFGGGFGLNTGLFYEFYTDRSMLYYDDEGYQFRSIWEEHSLNIPLHLEFRANFDEGFQLFVYGGASVDLGLSSTVRFYYPDDEWTSDPNDIYGRDVEMLRYNASWEAGAGIRFNSFQIQYQMSRGLINMAEHDAEYTVFQNKPMTLTLSWMF